MSQKTLRKWCESNGYDGVTKECVTSAFHSDNPKIQELAKRKKLEGIIDGKK
tara:strand:- start:4132 stop:4287 length:156 start_codon:yes stop_codon:yes gene_type:complete